MADGGGDHGGVPGVLRSYRYRPRTVAFQGCRVVDRWRVKVSVITVRGAALHFTDEITGAWNRAEQVLKALPADDRDAGVAQVIVHIGLAGVWLLIDWWREGDMLMHRHFFAPLDNPAMFTDVGDRHIGPCIWELAVQAYEREAWLRHVLANPLGPDLAAYLADGLTTTV